MDPLLYFLAALAYGLVGLGIAGTYALSARLREAAWYHAASLLAIVVFSVLAAVAGTRGAESLPEFHAGLKFFVFLAAGLPHAAVATYLGLHYSGWIVERITSPGSRGAHPRHPPTEKAAWARIEAYLLALRKDPGNPNLHESLGDAYLALDCLDSAVYQYRKAAEWLETGHAHAQALYKAVHVQVERQGKVTEAMGWLRRIVRLYPKSFFASYARRIIHRWEAHQDFRASGERTEAT